MIDSIKNEKIKYLKSLRNNKNIKEECKFLVEGFHLVNEAIKEGIVIEIFILENTNINFNGKTTIINENVMKFLTTLESITPVIALCKTFDYEVKPYKRVVLIDGIQDPGNVGTIIRSAVAFNVDAIVFSEDSVNIYNEKLIRSSQGMFFKIKLIKTNLINYIKLLKENNIRIYGTDLKGSIKFSEVKIPENYALVLGNEGAGVRKEILDLCDERILIEMKDDCESLNVGISAGIILYNWRSL